MTYLSELDAADLARRVDGLPVATRGVTILQNLQEWTNSHSDGWPYWAKPRNAAKNLVGLLAGLDRFQPEDIAEADLALALRPVKAFLTRQRVAHQEVLVVDCDRCGGTGVLWGQPPDAHGTPRCPDCRGQW